MDSIIFDVDGTLWDSTDVVAKAWTDYLRQKEQIDLTITAGQLKTLFGKPLAEIAALVFPQYLAEFIIYLISAQARHIDCNKLICRRRIEIEKLRSSI